MNKQLEALIVHLKRGEVALLPFDTCYGLTCDGTNYDACSRLYLLKQRPRSKPSALIVPDIKQIEQYASINQQQRKILEKLLPDQITVILQLQEKTDLPNNFVRTKYNTAAFRIIKSKLINEVLTAFKKPLLATSANLTGEPVILSRTDLIMHSFNQGRLNNVYQVINKIFLKPVHSTVIDLTTDEPEIIRPGAVSKGEILKKL